MCFFWLHVMATKTWSSLHLIFTLVFNATNKSSIESKKNRTPMDVHSDMTYLFIQKYNLYKYCASKKKEYSLYKYIF